MNELYLTPAEADAIWTDGLLENAERPSVKIPDETEPRLSRVLPLGHLALHPNATQIIEEQQRK